MDIKELNNAVRGVRDIDRLLEDWLDYTPASWLETLENFEERKAIVIPFLIQEKLRRVNAEEEIF